MTTEEERSNPDNNKKATNVLLWMQKEEKKQDNFMRGDYMHIGSSGESTASNDSAREGRREQGSVFRTADIASESIKNRALRVVVCVPEMS